ncbi:MAG: DUF2065 domain-containing protein [Alphaproteobacteria bacterium]|nr:DUF2065 domain-containing protein [Alphaproteobacteria bacterium]
MDSFTTYILSALALVFVIEGLIYALFTDAVKRMMAMALSLPTEKLRQFGLMMAALGLLSLWFIAKF